MKALVIDDSRTMRLVISRQLEEFGYEVVHATDGQQALELLDSCRESLPEVATVDWNMPVMNGLEFVHAVRADADLRQLSLMMVTTEAEQTQIVRALAAGAHEYLIKPFSPAALAEKLAYLGLDARRTVA